MSVITNAELPERLHLLQPFLVCPTCRSDLTYSEKSLRCEQCDTNYLISNGIPDLAIFDADDNFAVQSPSGKSYQHKFVGDSKPGVYDESFLTKPRKRQRTQREIQILETLLSSVSPINSLLNLPSGGGRLSQPLTDACSLLTEADISVSQVQFSRNNGSHSEADHVTWLAASAFHLPFMDANFDGVVCARLAHHFSSTEDHKRLFGELCRVAQRFVVVSFADSLSTKTISRKLRGKSSPFTLSAEQIRALADPLGYVLKETLTVSPLGSRHRYALLVKK